MITTELQLFSFKFAAILYNGRIGLSGVRDVFKNNFVSNFRAFGETIFIVLEQLFLKIMSKRFRTNFVFDIIFFEVEVELKNKVMTQAILQFDFKQICGEVLIAP